MTTPAELTARRRQLAAEIAWRQASITGAEADIGRQVAGLVRTGARPASPEVDAELRSIIAAEQQIAQLQQQAYAVDAEEAAEAAAAAAIDPASRCPACRSGVAPYQRYCPACGQRLVRADAPAAPQARPGGAPACERCGRPREPGISYCTGCGWRVDQSRVAWYRTRWLRIFVIGFLLYVFCRVILPHTHNAGALIIAELIIGAGLVPVAFVAYFYERATRDQTPFSVLATTFVAGALLGCAAAVILESAFDIHGNWQYLPVGFIEEGCKFAIVLCWLRRRDLYRPDKGLVIGAATGMGFAALETMQYGFGALLSSGGGAQGALHAMSATLDVRGLLAPLGHGTWTGILAAVVWFERSAGRSPFGRRVWISYVAVSLLHALYDITISSHSGLISLFAGAQVSIWGILFGLLGFAALMMIVRVTRHGGDPISQFFAAAHRIGQNMSQNAQAAHAAEVSGPAWPVPPGYPPPGPYPPQGYPPPAPYPPSGVVPQAPPPAGPPLPGLPPPGAPR